MGDDMVKVVKVKKNSDGDITDVMVSTGKTYPVEEAIIMARNNTLENVNVAKAKNGREYLRSNPNGNAEDNLDNLPTF